METVNYELEISHVVVESKETPTNRENVDSTSATEKVEAGSLPICDINKSILAVSFSDDNEDSGTAVTATTSSVDGSEETIMFPFYLRFPSQCSRRKKLLILDLNGLLVDVVTCPPKDRTPDKRVGFRSFFVRPYYLDFLNFCFRKFEVAVWSSRTRKNISILIDYLFGDLKNSLLFCWDLSHCTTTQFKTVENKHKPLVFKELTKVWNKEDPQLPWERGYFNESNTLLVDDSPYKALLNPANSGIHPDPYSYEDLNDNSLGVDGDLRVYLEQLSEAVNVQKFVETNPFGQKPVAEGNAEWSFYHEVISTLYPSRVEGRRKYVSSVLT
ncbi:unnamed protein product [Linum tenue]|uniref:Mitochondrial import inner membrane translocase subunit TIM50 n=1 Tax=Linum tenue TaxID=586396 RepID=A0AAV0HTK7_9ROSI|nr:unnamed protein product [Linum tenue]